MDILFASNDLKELCHNVKRAQKDLGKAGQKKLNRRLDELRDAETLAVVKTLHPRTHELKGSMAGEISMDLDGGLRLILCPGDNPPPRKPDGGLDWNQVRSVLILKVMDYHD